MSDKTGARHTPGPWMLHSDRGLFVAQDLTKDNQNAGPSIARLLPRGINGRKEADARLIAAAPELLEALSKMVSLYELQHTTETGREPLPLILARAAILKAEGR